MLDIQVYVAGKYEDSPRVQQVQQALIEAGLKITHDWTRADEPTIVFDAILDMHGVRNADFLLAVIERELHYKGTLAEIGGALALGKPVYVIGEADSAHMVFSNHPLYHNTEESSVFLFGLGVVIPDRHPE